jgi:predicted acyltransferase (DUF342 family)
MNIKLGDEATIHTRVWLDGAQQAGAIEADTVEGYIIRYKEPIKYVNNEPVMERVCGRVELARTDRGFGV